MFTNCTNDDNIKPTCFQDENRSVIETFNNARGKIIAPSEGGCPIYTLEENSGTYTLPFAPCNLPEDLKKDELQVVFSGYLFETFDVEDVCAFPFEITRIEKDN